MHQSSTKGERIKVMRSGYSGLSGVKGKTAVIVGGGGGLGRQIALAFARKGAQVVLAGRTRAQIEKVAEEIMNVPGQVLVIAIDATDNEQVKAMVAETIKRFGKIDVLVNCQGESLIKSLVQTTLEEWDNTQNSNLKSVFLTCRAVLPIMLEQKSGHIINVSSRVGVVPAGGVTAYSAAKSGVIGFSRSLALEVKSGNIKVNVIAPAPMDTPMRWKSNPDWDPSKVIHPDVVAEYVVLLASMTSSFVEDAVTPISVGY